MTPTRHTIQNFFRRSLTVLIGRQRTVNQAVQKASTKPKINHRLIVANCWFALADNNIPCLRINPTTCIVPVNDPA